ncbi:hypothetical protein R9C00_18395 [Flammeovirgaceae bacterium SG7u.111]|nr:hypothetical protein [Flammeovirgaceae bacterium SG7u.132]WPO33675.1 hypothetical protein R9C00_18395 [Flammeovirgaceae bacterium SG7u.111]
MSLLKKIEEGDEGEDSKLQQKKISELNQRLLLAKDSFELSKIRHELQLLKRNNPDEFQIFQLEEKVEKSYEWELRRAQPKVAKMREKRSPAIFLLVFMVIVAIVLGIYFLFF